MPKVYAVLAYTTVDSRNKTRLAKVVVVANSKQEVFSWTQLVVKYTTKNFGYDYTLYWINGEKLKKKPVFLFFVFFLNAVKLL